jgi:hypothetical protein
MCVEIKDRFPCLLVEQYSELDIYLQYAFASLNDNENWNIEAPRGLLKQIPLPYTIVVELHHIDRSYRDTYYMYFSNQHFRVNRYSARLSIFKGEITKKDLLGHTDEKGLKLQKAFIGTIVLNPLSASPIGRTLLAPEYLIEPSNSPVNMRLSLFKVHVYGNELKVNAFPYRMQDQETMRCAEVTILNIMEYFSNTYDDYKSVMPSEIINAELKYSHERVLPSNGISYTELTKVLVDFGLSPRIYNRSIMSESGFAYSNESAMRRILYCYVESGFPVAVNLVPLDHNGAGHSIICIGHEIDDDNRWEEAMNKRIIPYRTRNEGHALINSADFVDKYVVIDDNCPGYCIRSFDYLSGESGNMRVENITVPLYKRMFLDAVNATEVFESILQDDTMGLNAWGEDYLDPCECVIFRIFMASSANYKKHRTNCESLSESYIYASTPMPRFVWVCELYREVEYKKNGVRSAFGEIVIDATSAPTRQDRSLILMRYGSEIAVRMPDQTKSGFVKMARIPGKRDIRPYSLNLALVKKEQSC